MIVVGVLLLWGFLCFVFVFCSCFVCSYLDTRIYGFVKETLDIHKTLTEVHRLFADCSVRPNQFHIPNNVNIL